MTSRNYNLDLAKVYFAIIIVTTHLFLLGYEHNYGYLAVEFFFFSTGYFMMQSIEKNRDNPIESDKYLFHKIKIIIFPLIAAEILAFILRTYAMSQTVELTIRDIASNLILSVNELLFLQMANYPGFYAIGVGWYFSAMILGIGILYPFVKRNPDCSKCPSLITGIILLGIVYTKIGTLEAPDSIIYFIPSGLLRGIADICLGLFAYNCVMKLKNKKTPFRGKITIGIAEIIIIITTTAYMLTGSYAPLQFFIIILLWALFVIIMSEQSILSIKKVNIKLNPIVKQFGTLSLLILLNHYYIFDSIATILPDRSKELLLFYSICVIVMMIITCHLLSILIRKICKYGYDSFFEH